jgi:hypothetical protein
MRPLSDLPLFALSVAGATRKPVAESAGCPNVPGAKDVASPSNGAPTTICRAANELKAVPLTEACLHLLGRSVLGGQMGAAMRAYGS